MVFHTYISKHKSGLYRTFSTRTGWICSPQDESLTCASLTINRWHQLTRRRRAVPWRHCCGGGRLRGTVLVQGCTHLGGHNEGRGGVLWGTQGAILATSWWRRVRNNRVKRSSRTTSRGRHQTGLLLLLLLGGLCWGSVVWLLSIVRSWSGIWWMLLVVVLSI